MKSRTCKSLLALAVAVFAAAQAGAAVVAYNQLADMKVTTEAGGLDAQNHTQVQTQFTTASLNAQGSISDSLTRSMGPYAGISPGTADASATFSASADALIATGKWTSSTDYAVSASASCAPLPCSTYSGRARTDSYLQFSINADTVFSLDFIAALTSTSDPNYTDLRIGGQLRDLNNGDVLRDTAKTFSPASPTGSGRLFQGSLDGGTYELYLWTEATALAVGLVGSSSASSIDFDLQIGPRNTPVPLPAAAWLLLSGVGAVGAFARRRRTARA